MKDNILFVVIGPTGVGKTEVSLRLAEELGCPIVSADSRQMFRDIPIGTAAPTSEEQERVRHYFVGQLGLEDYYSASRYEKDAVGVISQYFAERGNTLILSGGSMMYVDAVCDGIDEMPDIADEVRQKLKDEYAASGLEPLVAELRQRDPEYAETADLKNPVRVIHALEICRQTGRTYTSFRTRDKFKVSEAEHPFDHASPRSFRIVKIGLDRPREELFSRINQRVDIMVKHGFIDEARRVLPWRNCNSLNTVGYKEMFRYLDGEWELPFTLDRIRKNTRVYAKKQLTWFRRDASITWFHPDDLPQILSFVQSRISEEDTP